MQNPFNPTFGDVPQIYLDNNNRAQQLATDIQQSNYARSILITGVRGSGKTTLLTKTEELLQQDSHCKIIDLISNDRISNDFLSNLQLITQTKFEKLFSQLGINIHDFNIHGVKFDINTVYDHQGPQAASLMMQKIKQQGNYIVVVIDEVTNNKALHEFAQIFNELKRHHYPIHVLMTGLPDIVLNIQRSDHLTFLLRSQKEYTHDLNNADIYNAYLQVFELSDMMIQRMVSLVHGYSYGFQLLGDLAYKASIAKNKPLTPGLLNEVSQAYKRYLFSNAYSKIFSDLSPLDKQYLTLAGQHYSRSEIAQTLNKDPNTISQYRQRALDQKLVIPESRGYVTYTLPFFNQYIQSVQNPESMYYEDLGLDPKLTNQ